MITVDTPYRYMDILLQRAIAKSSPLAESFPTLKLDLQPSKVALALLEEEAMAVEPIYKKYVSSLHVYNRTSPTITIKVQKGANQYYKEDKIVPNPYYDPDFDIKAYNRFGVIAENLAEELKDLGDITVIGFLFEPMKDEHHSKDQISVIYKV